MTLPISITGAGSSTPTTTTAKPGDIGRDQFLALLVAQLKNQDPLSPLQPDQFAAQLAQFSTVEQLTKLNTAFTNQSTQQAQDSLLTQSNLGASLIGRKVVAQGNEIVSDGSTVSPIRVNLAGSGSATIKIYDAAGQVLMSKDLGTLASGLQAIQPPSNLPAGSYTYSVDVTGSDGKPVPVTTYTGGTVDGVSFVNGQVMLQIAGTLVSINQLTEILP